LSLITKRSSTAQGQANTDIESSLTIRCTLEILHGITVSKLQRIRLIEFSVKALILETKRNWKSKHWPLAEISLSMMAKSGRWGRTPIEGGRACPDGEEIASIHAVRDNDRLSNHKLHFYTFPQSKRRNTADVAR
jgi:hypothetical protein